MKKLSVLLVLVILISLFGCTRHDAPTSPATIHTNPSTQADPGCVHQYADADCVTAKTCTLCGATRGEALGHDYDQGACTRCGEKDASYVSLTEGDWRADALDETGQKLEYITLQFRNDGTALLSADIYDQLSDVPAEDHMEDEEDWYDYSGVIYYYTGSSVSDTLEYTAEGSVITCTLTKGGEICGTLILERTAGNRLTVTYFEGDFSICYLQVGDVLGCI